jgi:colicin import membrane protein
MITRQASADSGIGVCITVSTVIHLAVFLLLLWWGVLFPPKLAIQETYYVDVVNLPVAAPRAGSPVQKGDDVEAPAPPAPESRMTAPSVAKPEIKGKKSADKAKADAEAEALAKKMAKLQEKAESKQEDAVMERLRRKVATSGSGRAGMPAAGGTEAGSSYNDYIKSRLEDALKKTISYSTKKPEVWVRLVIATDGRITRQKIESSSGDRTFELAVLRAIDIASEKFTPPPNRKVFENGFIFRPQGISSK